MHKTPTKVDRLVIGHVFNNYKEVCKVLEEKVTSGRSKQLQVKRWATQFSWVRHRYKWEVVGVKAAEGWEVER